MKQFMAVAALVFVGIAAWRIGDSLSADALGMALGVVFGVMAGLPAALLVMASNRRREVDRDEQAEPRRGMPGGQQGAYAHSYAPAYGQPPVIVLAGNGMAGPHAYGDPQQQRPRHALPAPHEMPHEWVDVRQFKVVGEKEELVDEW